MRRLFEVVAIETRPQCSSCFGFFASSAFRDCLTCGQTRCEQCRGTKDPLRQQLEHCTRCHVNGCVLDGAIVGEIIVDVATRNKDGGQLGQEKPPETQPSQDVGAQHRTAVQAAGSNATPIPTGSGLTSSEPQEDADFQTLVALAQTGLDRMFVGENFASSLGERAATLPSQPEQVQPGCVSTRPLRLDQVQQLFREGLALQSRVQRRQAEAELSIVQLHFDYTIDLPAPLTPDLTTEFVPYLVGRLVFARPGGSTDESRDGGSVFLAQIPLSSISLTPIAPGLVEADAQVGPARSRSPRGNGGLHGFRRSDTVETISDGDQPVLVSSPGGTVRHQEGGDGRGH